jgi:hypothetical protein
MCGNRLALVGVILGVMRICRTAFAAILAAALVVAGCSGGGGTHATPTTARQVVVNLGPCPKTYDPNVDLTKVNAGVKGLDRALVPIAAVRVRMCKYGDGFIGERMMVRPANVARFEAEANGSAVSLPTTPPPISATQGLTGEEGLTGEDCVQDGAYVVTFASASQQVELRGSCGGIGNGILSGHSSMHWFSELQHYTEGSTATGTVVGTIVEVGGLRMRRQIPGNVSALDRFGTTRRATTTATRPFSLTLRVGTYQFFGASPFIDGGRWTGVGGRSTCQAPAPVVVVAGKTSRVEVICSID